MDNVQITFTVSVPQANAILAGLAKLPYEAVSELIVDLKKQGDEQVAAAQKADEAA